MPGVTVPAGGTPWYELQCYDGCRPPEAPLRASGRAGELWVCEHGRVWKLEWLGLGRMHLTWIRVFGLAAWLARREARKR